MALSIDLSVSMSNALAKDDVISVNRKEIKERRREFVGIILPWSR
jgi:hypothetical protein